MGMKPFLSVKFDTIPLGCTAYGTELNSMNLNQSKYFLTQRGAFNKRDIRLFWIYNHYANETYKPKSWK